MFGFQVIYTFFPLLYTVQMFYNDYVLFYNQRNEAIVLSKNRYSPLSQKIIVPLYSAWIKPHLRILPTAGLEEASGRTVNCLWRGPHRGKLGTASGAESGLWPTVSKKLKPLWYSCIEVNSATT